MNLAPILMLVLSLLATGDGKRPPWLRTFGGGVASRMAAPSHDVYYIRTGDTLYVRGAISATKDVAQKYYLAAPPDNAHTDFYTAYILAKTDPYSLAGMTAGRKVDARAPVEGNTDACPIYTNNFGNVSGPHGVKAPTIVDAGHNKVAADIGSTWTDGGENYILAGISGTTLTFYSIPYASGDIQIMSLGGSSIGATLTHVRGATNQEDITKDAAGSYEEKSVTKSNSVVAYANGTTAIADGASGYASFVDIVESWTVVNPMALDTTQSGSWSWTTGSNLAAVTNTHRCYGGTTVTSAVVDFAASVSMNSLYAILCVSKDAQYDNRWYWVPGCKDTGRWPLGAPLSLALEEATFAGTNIRYDSTFVAGKPPAQHLTLWADDESSTYDLALAVGVVPIGDAAPQVRAARIPLPTGMTYGQYTQINTDEKWYVNMKGRTTTGTTQNITADSTYSWYAYRQFVDPSIYAAPAFGKTAYWNTAGGYDYVYINFSQDVENDATVVPSRMWGKTITVLDTLNVYNISATVPQTGILVSTTGSDTLGYAVLRVN